MAKEDIDRLQAALLEIIKWIGSTTPGCDGDTLRVVIGPACEELLENND